MKNYLKLLRYLCVTEVVWLSSSFIALHYYYNTETWVVCVLTFILLFITMIYVAILEHNQENKRFMKLDNFYEAEK